MLSKDHISEVVKVSIAKGFAYNVSDGAVDSLYKTIGDVGGEVVENLLPPVCQGRNKLHQESVTGICHMPDPSFEKTLCLISIENLVEHGSELFLEQVQGAQLRACPENGLEVLFLLDTQLATVPHKQPAATFKGRLRFGIH